MGGGVEAEGYEGESWSQRHARQIDVKSPACREIHPVRKRGSRSSDLPALHIVLELDCPCCCAYWRFVGHTSREWGSTESG